VNILFIVKKAISLLFMPLSIGILLLIIAFYFTLKNSNKTKYFLISGIIVISLLSTNQISNMLLKPLENNYKPISNLQKYNTKYILLLGGDRLSRGWEAIRLFHQIPNSTIITSGYAANSKIPEAIETAKIFYQLGIPKQNIIINNTPKDTVEEAYKIKQQIGTKQFFLVTSAYHMTRAMMIFKSLGLNPIAAPTNFLIQPPKTIIDIPNGYELLKTQKALHEYLGIAWLKINQFLKGD